MSAFELAELIIQRRELRDRLTIYQPIYKTSMKKWKRYEDHLGELLDNLNPEVTQPWDNPTEDNNPYESRIVHQGRVRKL